MICTLIVCQIRTLNITYRMLNKNMKDYLKVRGSFVDDNYKLIEETKYFEDLNVDGDYCCTCIQLFQNSFLNFFLTTNESFVAILLSLTFPSFCNKFSQEGFKGVYLQELNMG